MPKEVVIVGSFEGGVLSYNNPPRAPLQIASATVGFDPVVLHANKIGKNWAEKLPENSPLTGVSISTWNEWCSLPQITAQIKKTTPKTKIIVGGKYPTFYTAETLQIPGVDFVARGYGDKAWETITGNFSGGKSIDNLEEVGIYQSNKILPDNNFRVSPPKSLKNLPQPAYDSLSPPLESYIDPSSDLSELMRLPFGPNILSALGCLSDCTFCMNTLLKGQNNFGRQPVEYRPPALIAEEISILQQKTRLDEIPIFLTNPDSGQNIDHLMTTVEEIEKQRVRAILGIDIKVHSLFQALSERPDLDLFTKFKGKLHKIVLGPETFHPETQITIGKETSPDELIACLHFCEEIGALPMVQIIVGFPVDSDETLQYTLNILLKIRDQAPPFILNVHRATPFPGTTLYKEAKILGLIDSDTSIPDMTSGEMVMRSQYLSQDQLNSWRRKIISEFYSEQYLSRLLSDKRDLLRQEVQNSQYRGLFGEVVIR